VGEAVSRERGLGVEEMRGGEWGAGGGGCD
jgi:hypothetical protein